MSQKMSDRYWLARPVSRSTHVPAAAVNETAASSMPSVVSSPRTNTGPVFASEQPR